MSTSDPMDGSDMLLRFLEGMKMMWGWVNEVKDFIPQKVSGQCHTMVQERVPLEALLRMGTC